MSQPFAYTDQQITAIATALSTARFETYLSAEAGDEVSALRLYSWNTAIAGAFYGPLQALEVLLRNRVHEQLAASYGARWFDNSQILRSAEGRLVANASRGLERLGKQPTEGRLVAEMSFGFWVALFANAYDQSLWRSDLYLLFPKQSRNRRRIHDDLDRLRTLRNRIAHHEPIFQRRLDDDYQRVRDLVGFLSPENLAWLDQHSRVSDLLTNRSEVATW